MKRCMIVVENPERGLTRISDIVDMGLQFALKNGLTVFELELQLLTEEFIHDFNNQSFVLTSIREYRILERGPNARTVPITRVKGILNRDSAGYLKSNRNIRLFGTSILKIVLREPLKNETAGHWVAGQPYYNTKNWLQIGSMYDLVGSLKISDVETLYKSARSFGNYSAYFTPSDNCVYITQRDIRNPPSKPTEVYRISEKGVMEKRVEEFRPPLTFRFTSAKELRSAIRLSTIQLTDFTKAELAKLRKEWSLGSYEQAVIHLIEMVPAKKW